MAHQITLVSNIFYYFELILVVQKNIPKSEHDYQLLSINTQKHITTPQALKKQTTHHSHRATPGGSPPTHTRFHYGVVLILFETRCL